MRYNSKSVGGSLFPCGLVKFITRNAFISVKMKVLLKVLLVQTLQRMFYMRIENILFNSMAISKRIK